MFWELPKVEDVLNGICKKWFSNNCNAYSKGKIDVSEDTQAFDGFSHSCTCFRTFKCNFWFLSRKRTMHWLGFVEKLIDLWRKRRKILEAKAEISVSGVLANYTYRSGEGIMNKTLSYRSSYLSQLFKSRNRDITMVEKRQAALTMYENYICQYKASLQQCERDFDVMINVRL